jgi:hypothetical protein
MAAYFTRTGGAPTGFGPPGAVQSGLVANYQVQGTDFYIGVNGPGVTVTLPPSSQIYPGKSFYIKDESGLAGTVNSITLSGGGPTIDKSATITLQANFISLQVLWTGTFWSII